MTRAELLALRPGDIIRRKGPKRVLRVVLTAQGDKSRSLTPVGLIKVGRSWTDPCPSAWYDPYLIERDYVVTGQRFCSEEKARELRHWDGR